MVLSTCCILVRVNRNTLALWLAGRQPATTISQNVTAELDSYRVRGLGSSWNDYIGTMFTYVPMTVTIGSLISEMASAEYYEYS